MLRKCGTLSAFVDELERRRCGRFSAMPGSTRADGIGIRLFVTARVVGSVALGFGSGSGSVGQTSKRFDGCAELVVADVGLPKFAVVGCGCGCIGWSEILVQTASSIRRGPATAT